jgi:hypothetical protein
MIDLSRLEVWFVPGTQSLYEEMPYPSNRSGFVNVNSRERSDNIRDRSGAERFRVHSVHLAGRLVHCLALHGQT